MVHSVAKRLVSVSNRRRCAVPVLLFFVLLVLGGGAAYASGQKEDSLITARRLITEERYNDAILLLTQVIKKDPRRFDQAQVLLEQIDRARNLYNEKMAELVSVFNKGDLDRAYVILQQLASLDKAPNRRTLDAQEYARQTATVVYNNNRFRKIMEEALPLLAAGRYSDAVSTYLTGFNLGYDSFASGRLGNIVIDQVLALRATLQAKARHFESLGPPIEAAVASAMKQANPGDLSKAIDVLGERIGQLEEDRSTEASAAAQLLALRDSILKQHGSARDVFFLTYLEKFVDGRGGESPPEGILFAIEGARTSALSRVYNRIAAAMEENFTASTARLQAGDYAAAATDYRTCGTYVPLAARVSGLWDPRLTTDPSLALNPGITASRSPALAAGLPEYLLASTRGLAVEDSLKVVSALSQIETINSGLDMADSLDALNRLRVSMDTIGGTVQSDISRWQDLKAKYGRLAAMGYSVGRSIAAVDGMIDLLNGVRAKGATPEVTLVDRIARLQLAPAKGILAQQQTAVEAAQRLLTGVPLTIGDETVHETIQAKYPAKANDDLKAAQETLGSLGQTLQSVVVDIESAPPAVAANPGVQNSLKAAKAFVAQTESLLRTAKTATNTAQSLLFQAERYRQEGDNNLRAAQDAIARQQYAVARERIAAAAERLDRSLSFAENPNVRRARDSTIPELSRQITDAENDIVVRDVRSYINQGKALYAQSNYAEAQNVFLRAQARWRLTNAQDNPEITTWLQYVDTALTINSGLVISSSDPLYSDMTQVLNLAESDYAKARALIADGQKSEALSLLADAQRKILYVQVPFPLNQEARVLGLRILELTEPNNFQSIFQQRFEAALAKFKTDPQETYVDLKNLQAVEPNFPGLTEALYRTEIATGLRRPPPDPQKIQESDGLYQKAFDIVRTNVRAQYPIAISYLNKAIELDPNNTAATSLKDRLAIDTGGETTVVLSNYAQIQFRQAEEQFIAKSYYEALRIVNQLLKDPANQNYSPLLDLKRRIESKI